MAAPEPAHGFLAEVLALAEAALARRGYGEERMLAPLWQRLEKRENPGLRVRRVFTEEGGLIEFSDVERNFRERDLATAIRTGNLFPFGDMLPQGHVHFDHEFHGHGRKSGTSRSSNLHAA